MLKNWCFWTVVLEKTLESPLDSKEIQPVHSEGDQPWVFSGRNDAKAETPVLWPPHAKSWLIGKDFDAGSDWGQEEKRMTEDEMVGWHHRLDGHESEWTLGVGDGEGGLVCCNSWGGKESDMTEWLNWTELLVKHLPCSRYWAKHPAYVFLFNPHHELWTKYYFYNCSFPDWKKVCNFPCGHKASRRWSWSKCPIFNQRNNNLTS